MKVDIGAILPMVRRKMLIRGMHKLHDALSQSPLHNKYWVAFGALLGWAREGGLLKHDPDIDFHFWKEDLPLFLESVELLKQAGFEPYICWGNCAGQITEYCFKYKGLRFEFFVAERANGNTRCTFFSDSAHAGVSSLEIVFETPGCELDEFEFHGRTWQKPANHEQYLTTMYNDWKTPNKNFNHQADCKAIISRTPIPGKRPYRSK